MCCPYGRGSLWMDCACTRPSSQPVHRRFSLSGLPLGFFTGGYKSVCYMRVANSSSRRCMAFLGSGTPALTEDRHVLMRLRQSLSRFHRCAHLLPASMDTPSNDTLWVRVWRRPHNTHLPVPYSLRSTT